MKAIETEYCGYRFRSRIEARWAVLLNYLEVPWEYEKEGYELGDGVRYLPDFWLPENDLFLEIKGAEPSDPETDKARKLNEASGNTVAMVIDLPKLGRFADTRWFPCPPTLYIPVECDERAVCIEIGHIDTQFLCPVCHEDAMVANAWFGTVNKGDATLALGPVWGGCPHIWNIEIYQGVLNVTNVRQRIYDLPTILSGGDIRKAEEAIAAARHARFEHGRNGD